MAMNLKVQGVTCTGVQAAPFPHVFSAPWRSECFELFRIALTTLTAYSQEKWRALQSSLQYEGDCLLGCCAV
jgi:hypothetical protein